MWCIHADPCLALPESRFLDCGSIQQEVLIVQLLVTFAMALATSIVLTVQAERVCR